MLQIAAGFKPGKVVYRESPSALKKRLKEERKAAKLQKLSSLAGPRGAVENIRLLPWEQFVARLQYRRDLAVRAHIRWCMRTAVRNCESLRRAEGRSFELRPGGRHNLVSSGSMWHESPHGVVRLGSNDAKILFQNGRYLNELDENLRKLLCPDWAVPTVKRAIRAKLAQGWDLDEDGEELEVL